MISTAHGEVYDLDRMFAKLNRRYFDGQIPKPTITWSQRRTKSILGHHDHIYDSITISKTLDSQDVPEWFVEYILYHEMLHIKHPARLIKGRRYYHTSAFRLDERRFPYYEQAQKWLDRLARLRRVPARARRLKFGEFGTIAIRNSVNTTEVGGLLKKGGLSGHGFRAAALVISI